MLRNNKRFSDVNARKIFRLRQFFHLPTKEVGEHLLEPSPEMAIRDDKRLHPFEPK